MAARWQTDIRRLLVCHHLDLFYLLHFSAKMHFTDDEKEELTLFPVNFY